MKKNSTVFIDSSAWIAILDRNNPNHKISRSYYENLLNKNIRLVTNNFCVDNTISFLKLITGNEQTKKFLSIIDESVLTINLHVDWISRRIRRNAMELFLNSSNAKLTLQHFYIQESLKRKRVDFIFSFDPLLKEFDFPVMPQD
jgi:uncharacterized protein